MHSSTILLAPVMVATASRVAAARTPSPPSGIQTFNKALESATVQMDSAALLALWDEDGVSLLPATPPIVGKKAIGRFLDDVTAGKDGRNGRANGN